MEKLSLAISEAVQYRLWHPVRVGSGGPSFSHLFFADDVLLFSKATSSQARIIVDMFKKFSDCSGLRINVVKSKAFFSKGVLRRRKSLITAITSIDSTNYLGKYLGFPIFHRRVRKEDFGFIIDKMQQRLASWKSKLLNKAGRVTLVKSVISAIPTYYMQMNWIPTSVCTQMDCIARNFVWKGHSERGVHLVGWNKVIQPRKEGGLGVRSAREANIPLLGKLVWDLQHQPLKPWASMLLSKYVPNGVFMDCPRKSGSPIWNSILKAREALREGYQFRIGNGQSLFWYAPWTPLCPLCDHVFAVVIQDTTFTIKDIFFNNTYHWELFTTVIPDFIKDIVNQLYLVMHDHAIDRYIWQGNSVGIYSIKDGYNWLLKHKKKTNPNQSLDWNWVWRLQAHEKIKFLLWTE